MNLTSPSLRPAHVGLVFTLLAGLAQIGAGCGDDTGGSTSTGPGAGGGAQSVCGDNLLDDDLGEECDDGDFDDTDDCKADCTLNYCGDGVVHVGDEECDDGNDDDGDKCTSDCTAGAAGCGNGIPEEGEECDDGNAVDDDGCTRECKAARCGDGVVQDGETCDDGNADDADACSNACTSNGAGCGNGSVDAGEDCDDGNASNADECLADCTAARCGDGYAQAGVEACDDGNTDDADFCRNDCTVNDGVSYGCPGAPLSLGVGQQSYELTTADGDNADAGSCGGGEAPEIVFQVTPDVDGTLVVQLTGDGSYDSVLYARTGSCAGTEVACSDVGFEGGVEAIQLDVIGGEPVWVFADGYGQTQGSFIIDFELLGGSTGDTCPGEGIEIDAFEQVDLSGNTQNASPDYLGAFPCDAGEANDVVYAITPLADGIITAAIQADFDAMLYDLIDCGDASTQLDCADAELAGGIETIQIPAYVGETVYLVVDGFDQESGPYELTLNLAP